MCEKEVEIGSLFLLLLLFFGHDFPSLELCGPTFIDIRTVSIDGWLLFPISSRQFSMQQQYTLQKRFAAAVFS
jgi:hypothetical protein